MTTLVQVRLSDVWAKYRTYRRITVSPKTQQTDAMLARMLARMGVEAVVDVSAERLDAERTARLQAGISPRTVNMETAALMRMLRWAEQRGLIDTNPLPSIREIPDPGDWHPRRALEPDEIRRLLESSSLRYRRIWATFLSTGMRRNELVFITGQDVDLESATVSLRASATKTRKARLCYLGPRVTRMLALVNAADGAPVFPAGHGGFHTNNLLKRLRHCCVKAEITLHGVDLHALRATFYTVGGMAGVAEQTVDTLVGHRSGSVGFRRYWKPASSYLHEAAEKIEELVWGSLTPESMGG